MFDERYQVSATFFTVKYFLIRVDGAFCRITIE